MMIGFGARRLSVDVRHCVHDFNVLLHDRRPLRFWNVDIMMRDERSVAAS